MGPRTRVLGPTGRSYSYFAVKAQRLDDRHINLKSNNLMLRYNLKGFEKSCVVNSLSNLMIKRNYTTALSLNNSLNPWFVTGFTDAEGCFTVILQKKILKLKMVIVYPHDLKFVYIKKI